MAVISPIPNFSCSTILPTLKEALELVSADIGDEAVRLVNGINFLGGAKLICFGSSDLTPKPCLLFDSKNLLEPDGPINRLKASSLNFLDAGSIGKST